MVPKIASYLGSIQAEGNVMFAVAAVVSITIPIFLLVMVFQRYLVSGLTAGAVEGLTPAEREQAALTASGAPAAAGGPRRGPPPAPPAA